MTKATPQVIIKETNQEPQDIGLKGGPVNPTTKSWRERAGKRKVFGSPAEGWPDFDEGGNVVKRQTSKEPAGMKTPRGFAYICFGCAQKAGLSDEFTVMQSVLLHGTCDICNAKQKIRMSVEKARYETLLSEQDRT